MRTQPQLALAALILVVCPAAAYSQTPQDQTVRFLIRENPQNPESPVKFSIQVELKAAEVDGNSVAWIVQYATFQRISNGVVLAEWQQDAPEVISSDGYWWVEHADAAAPLTSEFKQPPRLLGRATSLAESVPDLDFDIKGSIQSPPSGNPALTSLNYSLAFVGNTAPEEEGDDEPVGIDGDEGDGPGNT